MSLNSIEQFLSNKIPKITSSQSCEDVLQVLKKGDFEDILHIFILDTQNRIDGFVELSELFKAKESSTILQLMKPSHCIGIDNTFGICRQSLHWLKAVKSRRFYVVNFSGED